MAISASLTVGVLVETAEEFASIAPNVGAHDCVQIPFDEVPRLAERNRAGQKRPLDAVLVGGGVDLTQLTLLGLLSQGTHQIRVPIMALSHPDGPDPFSLVLAGADFVLHTDVPLARSIRAHVIAYRRICGRVGEASAGGSPRPTVRVGDLVADLTTYQVRIGDFPVDLAPREFDLLVYLMRHEGQVVSKDEIIENVWGLSFDPETNIVNVYVHYIRKRFSLAGHEDVIHTKRGRGFMIIRPNSDPPKPSAADVIPWPVRRNEQGSKSSELDVVVARTALIGPC